MWEGRSLTSGWCPTCGGAGTHEDQCGLVREEIHSRGRERSHKGECSPAREEKATWEGRIVMGGQNYYDGLLISPGHT